MRPPMLNRPNRPFRPLFGKNGFDDSRAKRPYSFLDISWKKIWLFKKSIIRESSIFLSKKTGFIQNRVTERKFDISSDFDLTSALFMLGRIIRFSSFFDLTICFSMLEKNPPLFFVFRLDISILPHFEHNLKNLYFYRIKSDKYRYFFDNRLAINELCA